MSIRASVGLVTANRIVVFVLSFASVILVSRLLTPAEIGVFSVSVAMIGIAHVLRDFGVSQYLIQLKDVSQDDQRAAFSVTMAISWSIALMMFLLRHPAASFYGHSGVADVLAVVALNFLILPIGAPLRSMLQREMQFGKTVVISLSHHSVQAVVTVAAAWFGASYMSLAWGAVAGTLTNVLVAVWMSPAGALQRPTLRGWRKVLGFGSRASTATLAAALGRGAPDMVFGRTLGMEAVGYFSRAAGLITALLEQLLYITQTVYVPSFAKGLREGQDPVRYYCTATELLTGITVPAIAVLAWLTPELIVFLFGARWDPAVPLGQMLCAFALITAPLAIADSSLVASGNVAVLMRNRLQVELSRWTVLLLSAWLALPQVVAALGLVYLLEAVSKARILSTVLGLSALQLWRAVSASYAVALCALAASAIGTHVAGRLLGQQAFVMLAAGICMALIGWLIGLWWTRHPFSHELPRIVEAVQRRLRGRM